MIHFLPVVGTPFEKKKKTSGPDEPRCLFLFQDTNNQVKKGEHHPDQIRLLYRHPHAKDEGAR